MARDRAGAASGAGPGSGDPGLALRSLVATSAIQVYTSVAGTAAAVLAPALAADLDITPKWIGVFIGLVYVGGMLASLSCGTLIRRWGAIRLSQVAVLVCALGIGSVAVLPAHGVALAGLAAVVIGLGYGAITPASSHVLARTTPASRMGLVFSIKQTGVPAGVALGGLVLPALSLAIGWRVALGSIAVAGLAIAWSAQSIRAALDDDRQPATRLTLAGLAEPLALVLRSPVLLRLSGTSFGLSAVQVSVTTFLVVFLTGAMEWSLVAAGLMLTLTTVAGMIGRIGWGVVADHVERPRNVLVLIAGLAAAGAAAFAFAGPGWPVAAIAVVAFALGGTAIGWNGVQLAEVARNAPPGKAGAVTGATGFITFFGVVVGPPAFGAIAASPAGYRGAFLLLALLATGAALLARVARHPSGA